MSFSEQVKVVGVDNDEIVCECANPTLSSIAPDFRRAGDDSEVQRLVFRALLLDAGLFLAMAVLFLFFGGEFTDLFRGEMTSSFDQADFRTIGAALFRIVILANIFETLQVTFAAALRGVGDTGYMLKATLAAECAGWIPLIVLVLALCPSITYLWWTIVIWHGICAVLLVRRWQSGAWRKIQLI